MTKPLFDAFFAKAPVPFAQFQITFQADGVPKEATFLAANPSFEKLFGKSQAELSGQPFLRIFPRARLQIDQWALNAQKAIQNNRLFDQTVPDLFPGKSIRVRLFPISDNQIGCILRDVSAEVMLREEIDGFLAVSVDMFCVADPHGIFLKVNRQFEEVLGFSISEMEGQNFFDFIHPEDIGPTEEAVQLLMSQHRIQKLINRYRAKDGQYKTFEWRAVPIGNVFYAAARDISDQVEKEAVLRMAADIDPLTGLFNRHYLYGRIQTEISLSENRNLPLSMIAVDIDHFKYVNDIWGHPVGDEVLEQIASLLKNSIRFTDFLARVGGEEFVALLPNTAHEGALVVARKMHEALNTNPHPRVGKVTASFGVAQREAGEDFLNWYKRADEAVYYAKESGRNRVVSAGEKGPASAAASVYMTWKEEWDSGNVTIDAQHRELIDVGNKLVFLAMSGAIPHQISRQIDQLLVHAANHFATEESVLRSAGYPGLDEHMIIHRNLLNETTELAEGYVKKRTQSPIFLSFVINDLIIGHLLHEDQKFFEHLRNASRS